TLAGTRHRQTSIHETPHANIVHEAQHEENRQHAGPPGAHQRQGDSRYGHPAHHHSHVNQDMEQHQGCHAHSDIYRGQIWRRLSVLHNSHQQHEVQRQYHYDSYKSVLFGERRKNKIGMRNGKEAKLRLRSLGHPFAPHATSAHRNLGLNHLVSGAARVPVRIQETHQARLLIGLKEMDPYRQHQDHDDPDSQQITPVQACQKGAYRENWEIGQRRSQIRLLHNQQHRHHDQGQQLPQIPELQSVAVQLGHEASYQQYYHQLDEFRHLQVNARGQWNPTRGSERLFADQEHRDQEADRQQIERGHVLHEGVVVDRGGDPHQQQAGADPNNLLPPGVLPSGAVGRAKNLDDAQRADDERDDHHAPVDVTGVEVAA